MKMDGTFPVVTDLRKFCIFFFGFELLKTVAMKSSIFWECSPVKVNRYFGGIFHLHLQSLLAACCSLSWLFLHPEDVFTGLDGVIYWNAELFFTQF
jgi:hypothetical protein